jgi:hypothetical protein
LAGNWEFEVDRAVLGPGASLPLSKEGEYALAHVISGSASYVTQDQGDDARPDALMNDGAAPVVAVVIRLRAHL